MIVFVMKAIWNNTVLADSDDIVKVEGNSYFPMESIKKEYFKESDSQTLCPWKGKASYFSVTVNGKTNNDCAWYYPKPSFLVKKIKGRVSFWRGVEIV